MSMIEITRHEKKITCNCILYSVCAVLCVITYLIYIYIYFFFFKISLQNMDNLSVILVLFMQILRIICSSLFYYALFSNIFYKIFIVNNY